MSNKVIRERLLTSTVIAGSLLIAAPAFAQDTSTSGPAAAASGAQGSSAVPATPETQAQDTTQADIIVTGSRIARPDLQASSPVAVLSGQALRLQNAVTVEQLLTVNPQFVPGETAGSNNPGDGAATVDLRGLGSNRTLVLIDGKRAPAYDTSGSVDVNTIPTALIKRIDILTGGASAVYGSDAVSGVVNFILDDRYEGLRLDASSQITQRGDGALKDASITGGIKLGDRGNLVASAGYSKRDGVTFGQRRRLRNSLDSSDLVSSGGSSNTVPTAFDIPGAGRQQVTADGGLTPDVQLYNFDPVNYAFIPLERYNAMALGRYELTDNIEVYGRANYEHVKSITTLAPTATAGYSFDISPDNPFLTPAEREAFFDVGANPNLQLNDDGSSTVGIRRRIIETGGRVENHTTKSYQFVGGLRGALGDNFKYDVFAQYGEVKRHEILKNDLSYSALSQSLDAITGPDGTAVCRDASNGCVPLNLFTTATIPQNQLAFVLRNALQDTKTTQFVTGANIAGDLTFLQSPLASAPAAISVGVEYRREKAATTVSDDYASGDLIYYGQGQNIGGKYNTKEAYIEVKMPLVQDKPFIKALDLEGGFRYSKYSTVGSVYTYKGGGDYSPFDGLRFRGIYQRAVRAPSVFELFSPVVSGTGSLATDPCAGTGVSATVAAICYAQGAPAGSVNANGGIPQPISGQINIFQGGNPNLKAEKTDTFTVGAVINPPGLRQFSLSVDYYNIRIANAIDVVPPSITIAQCYNVDQDANSAACSSIVRSTIDGSLSGGLTVGVPEVLGNIAVIKTDGIDVSAGYHGGNIDGFNYALSVSGTYVRNYKRQSDPSQAAIQCVHHFGGACDLEPLPKWKHVADLTLGFNKLSFLTRWRFIGSVKEDAQTDILKSRIGSFSYFDETASIAVSDKFNFRLGVQNLFNKKPPVVGDTVGTIAELGNTFPNTYDILGRTFFAGVSASF